MKKKQRKKNVQKQNFVLHENRINPEIKSGIFQRGLKYLYNNYWKFLFGLLVILGARSLSRLFSFNSPSTSSQLLPNLNPPPECEGLYLYTAGPTADLSLSSYQIILMGGAHDPLVEAKLANCMNALSSGNDLALLESHEIGKEADCKEFKLKNGFRCEGTESSEEVKDFGPHVILEQLEIEIAKQIHDQIKNSPLASIKAYLAQCETMGDKNFKFNFESQKEFIKSVYSEQVMKNIMSKVAYSIQTRLNKGEKYPNIINNILIREQELVKKLFMEAEDPKRFFARNKLLAKVIKDKIELKKVNSNSHENMPFEKLFVYAGGGHLATVISETTDDYRRAREVLYKQLDELTEENPYAVLLHEDDDLDTSRGIRLGN